MLNKISEKFHSWAKGRWVLVAFIADALMAGYIMPVAAGIMAFAANNSVTPIDLMFFYTPEEAYAMIDKYGEAGRSIYWKIELTADIIYPIAYTLFFGLLMSWLFQRGFRSDHRIQTWNVMPVGGWFFDMLENAGIVSMLSVYPAKPEFLAWLTMIFGTLKWAVAAVSIVLILIGLVRAALNGFRKQE